MKRVPIQTFDIDSGLMMENYSRLTFIFEKPGRVIDENPDCRLLQSRRRDDLRAMSRGFSEWYPQLSMDRI